LYTKLFKERNTELTNDDVDIETTSNTNRR